MKVEIDVVSEWMVGRGDERVGRMCEWAIGDYVYAFDVSGLDRR